jgi:hypothetical protein
MDELREEQQRALVLGSGPRPAPAARRHGVHMVSLDEGLDVVWVRKFGVVSGCGCKQSPPTQSDE